MLFGGYVEPALLKASGPPGKPPKFGGVNGALGPKTNLMNSFDFRKETE